MLVKIDCNDFTEKEKATLEREFADFQFTEKQLNKSQLSLMDFVDKNSTEGYV
jgi:hypothetical protein